MINIATLTMPYRCKLIMNAYKNWIKKSDRVLDMGCGNGAVANFLRINLGVNITVCDIENHLTYDLPFVKISNSRLPFSNKSYDVVLLNDVLHHVKMQDQRSILQEALRVAKTVLVFEAQPTFYGKFADTILNKLHYGQLYIPLSFRDIKDWQKIFKQMGINFKVKQLSKPFWYPFSHFAFYLENIKKI